MKNLLLIAFVLFSTYSIGQTTILFQDFNNGIPAGWQMIDNDGLTPYNDPAVNYMTDAWNVREDYDSTGIGDSILVSTSWFDPAGVADNWLILPAVTLGNSGNYLSFDSKSVDHSYPDGLEIRFSTGGVNIWEFFTDTTLYDTIASPPYWTNQRVSLDGYGIENETVYIAFRHYSDDQFVLAIDNIKIDIDDPVSILDKKLPEVAISPNPATDIVRFETTETVPYKITDLNGKIVDSGNSQGTIPLELNAGLYFVQIDGYQPSKLIVK